MSELEVTVEPDELAESFAAATLPRAFLRARGIDPNREFIWWRDPFGVIHIKQRCLP